MSLLGRAKFHIIKLISAGSSGNLVNLSTHSFASRKTMGKYCWKGFLNDIGGYGARSSSVSSFSSSSRNFIPLREAFRSSSNWEVSCAAPRKQSTENSTSCTRCRIFSPVVWLGLLAAGDYLFQFLRSNWIVVWITSGEFGVAALHKRAKIFLVSSKISRGSELGNKRMDGIQ